MHNNISEIPFHILKTPNLASEIGALRAALRLSPNTARESTGSITPSSHSLQNSVDLLFILLYDIVHTGIMQHYMEYYMKIVDNESEGVGKYVVLAYFKALSQNMPGTEENHENSE
jgi:hypothetical protein